MTAVVASDRLERSPVWAVDDPSVKWAGAFAVYGGHGTTQSSVIVYEIEPGKRLGWQHPRHRRDAFFAAAMFMQTFDGVMLPPQIPRPRHAQSCGLNACRRESTGLRISDLELI